jgi:hypothetical protein
MISITEFENAPRKDGAVFDLSEIIKFKKLLGLIKEYPGYNLVLKASQKLQTGYYEELLGLMSIKTITPDIVENILRSKKRNRNDSSPIKRRLVSKPTFTYFIVSHKMKVR